MSKTNLPAVPANDRELSYKPFMGTAEIKLTVGMVKSLICAKTKQGHTCDDAQAMKFMMLCQARGLNPWEGDAFLIGYDSKDGPSFSLITAHQAFLKRAETHPEYDGMESGVLVMTRDNELVARVGDFTVADDALVGGWATVHFKHRRFPMVKRVKLKTFDKGFGRWRDDPEGMIVKCAEADALRSSFPTMLGGMYLDEELPSGGASTEGPLRAKRSSVLDRVVGTQSGPEAVTIEAGARVADHPSPEPPAERKPAAKPRKRRMPPAAGDHVVGRLDVLKAEVDRLASIPDWKGVAELVAAEAGASGSLSTSDQGDLADYVAEVQTRAAAESDAAAAQ